MTCQAAERSYSRPPPHPLFLDVQTRDGKPTPEQYRRHCLRMMLSLLVLHRNVEAPNSRSRGPFAGRCHVLSLIPIERRHVEIQVRPLIRATPAAAPAHFVEHRLVERVVHQVLKAVLHGASYPLCPLSLGIVLARNCAAFSLAHLRLDAGDMVPGLGRIGS